MPRNSLAPTGLKPTSSPKGNVRCFNKMEQTYISNLKYACSRLKKDNILGVIEPICPQAVPNYFLDSFYQAMKYIKLINEPNLKLQLDFYHLQRLHGNITENLNMFFPYVGHIQISQVPDRHEPDSDGELDYHYIFNLLQSLEYSGFIGLEYKPKGDTIDGLKWLKTFPNCSIG
ncbi:unnamed protein product [Gordionus sp. m RMFG-2023]|uniref:putative hydroxypyruvate isomerase isoform X3 n=1 Tax=Gordionus sp. m RMFG-2023 TaxID=3053472 RepID=UPI0030DF5863